jgi:hypothetical protein
MPACFERRHGLWPPAAGGARPGHPRLADRSAAHRLGRRPQQRQHGYTRNRIRHGLLPAIARPSRTFARPLPGQPATQPRPRRCWTSWPRWTCRPLGLPPAIAALQARSAAAAPGQRAAPLAAPRTARRQAAQLDELLDQLQACTTRGHGIRIKVGRDSSSGQGDTLEWHRRLSAVSGCPVRFCAVRPAVGLFGASGKLSIPRQPAASVVFPPIQWH